MLTSQMSLHQHTHLRADTRVPATVIVGPEAKLAQARNGEQNVLLDVGGAVEWVDELFGVAVDKRPQGDCLVLDFFFLSLLLTAKTIEQINFASYIKASRKMDNKFCLSLRVVEECAKEARVEVVQYGDEEVLVELESVWKLARDLPNAVDELEEHGRSVSIRVTVVTVTDSLGEFVSKAEPLFLDYHLETAEGAVVGV